MSDQTRRKRKDELADRDWWKALEKSLPWKLYGWTYRSAATFKTEPYKANDNIEITGIQRDQIMRAVLK